MAERIIESGRYKSCSILVAVTDWMSRPNPFLVSTVPERTALHWERLEKKDPTGRKLYWQTAVVLLLWSLRRRVNLWDALMKMVSVVRFQEVRETSSLQHWFDHILGYSGEIHAEEFEAHFQNTLIRNVNGSWFLCTAHLPVLMI